MFRFKKIAILTIILVSFLAVSAVSAAENVTSDVVSVDDSHVILENDGNFTDLSNLIENTPGGATLELDKDYQNDGSSGIEGINITKTITVDGKNHILDGKSSSKIFNVNAGKVILKNIVFKDGYSKNRGGAISANAACDIINCSFINCSATNMGGAIYGNPSVSIVNCSFTNNSAYFAGSIFNCFVTGCNFTNNSANSGGAVYDCSVIDCRFENNNANEGGAISINEDNHVIHGCSFINCSSSILGGAISFNVNSIGSVDDCTFVDNAADKGGAIFIFASADVSNCSFTNNSADLGGAIAFNVNSMGSVDGCTFVDNNAGEGGAIYIFTSVEVSNSTFTNNSANLGGGIYFNDSNCLISNSIFSNSKLFSENQVNMHNVTVDGEVFNTGVVGNFSELSGLIKKTQNGNTLNLYKDYKINGSSDIKNILILKGIVIDGKGHTIDANKISNIFQIGTDDVVVGKVILKNIIFKNGHSKDSGGAINCYYTNDVCTLSNCSFIDCSAIENGGAINFDMMTEDNFVIDCSFEECSAGGTGGAVYISNFMRYYGVNNKIDNCSFVKCIASEKGGCIYISDSNYNVVKNDVVSCSFINCSAKNDGGAIYIEESSVSNYAISNCSFVNCSAKNKGGAIYNEKDPKSRISSSYFENNKAKSASAVFGGVIFDCVLKDNVKPEIDSTNNYAEIVPKEMTSNQDGILILKFPKDAKGTVEMFVNGSSMAVVNVADGSAKFDLSQYIGNYPVTFAYSGDSNYNAFTKDSNATIIVVPTKIVASNVNALYTSGKTYKITVYKQAGVIASRVNVVIKINNKSFKTLKTNDKGVVTFKITQAPGTYNLTITSLGRTATKKLTVKHLVTLKYVTVKRSAKSVVLQASLAKVNGKYLKNKQVTFKFNGKTYKAKTNSKGVAKVTIKSNVLKKLKTGKKVTYQATYLKDTVKRTVVVKK